MATEEKEVEVSGEESYISKLTIKTLGCNPSMVKTLKKEQGVKLAIARMYGKASAVKYQEDKENGKMYTYFAGTFEGVNLQDGTVLRSGKMFLPEGISNVVETAIKAAQEKDDKASVSFAFEIRSVQATNPIGYSYEAAAIQKPEAEDELAAMRKQIVGFTANKPLLGHEPKDTKALGGGTAGPQVLEGKGGLKKSA